MTRPPAHHSPGPAPGPDRRPAPARPPGEPHRPTYAPVTPYEPETAHSNRGVAQPDGVPWAASPASAEQRVGAGSPGSPASGQARRTEPGRGVPGRTAAPEQRGPHAWVADVVVTPPLPEGSGFSLPTAVVGDGQALPAWTVTMNLVAIAALPAAGAPYRPLCARRGRRPSHCAGSCRSSAPPSRKYVARPIESWSASASRTFQPFGATPMDRSDHAHRRGPRPAAPRRSRTRDPAGRSALREDGTPAARHPARVRTDGRPGRRLPGQNA